MDIDKYTTGLTLATAIGHSVCIPLLIFFGMWLMCRMFGQDKRGRDALPALPFALFAALVFDFFYLALAFFFGPEFPSLIGSTLTMLVIIPAAKKGFLCPRKKWDFAPSEQWDGSWKSKCAVKSDINTGMGSLKAWTPYILISLLLVATRLDWFGLKTSLTSDVFRTGVSSLLGREGINWNWNWGWCPGIFPFVLICIAGFLLYRMNVRQIRAVFTDTFKQTYGAAIAPAIGALGSFMSGESIRKINASKKSK